MKYLATLCLALLPAIALACTNDYKWDRWPDSDEYALMYRGGQIGSWNATKRVYRPLDGGKWGPACSPPITPPDLESLPTREPVKDWQTTGVDRDKIGSGYSIDGKKCSREQAMEAVEKGIPDDAGKLRLTVIGPEADRKQVMTDLLSHPSLSALTSRLLVQAYNPDARMIAGLGFVTTGKPTIYLQAGDGKVLHRQDDYSGPDKLAEAIRKADGSYKPASDPNLNNPLPFKMNQQTLLLAGCAAAGVYLLTRKKS